MSQEDTLFYYPGLIEPIRIIYEDNHLIAAVKPPGVLAQEDHTGRPDMLTILKAYIKERYNKPGAVFLGLVHRLDQPVGGVMVFARTSKAASRISKQIRERTVGKKYLAVVCGRMPHKEGVLEDRLIKNRDKNTVRVSEGENKEGKTSRLRYTELQVSADGAYSLLKISLETGRAHQIRVQLSNAGCPIFGDHKYNQKTVTGQTLALWAACYKICHPVGRDVIEFTAQPPQTFPWTLFSEV